MNSEHEDMIDDCLARDSKLTAWERGFIHGLHERLDAGREPTERQAEVLDKIWERVTA